MEHLCVLQLKTSLATLVTTWFTLDLLDWHLGVAMRRRKCQTIQQKKEWTQKWPYEKDTLARQSTLCGAGALIGWLW
jgi:hypothetical protein